MKSKKKKITSVLSAALAAIGRKGGKVKSHRKAIAAADNLKKANEAKLLRRS